MIERARGEASRMHRAHEVDERMAFLVTQKNRVVGEMILLVHEIERDRLFRALGATSVTDYMRKRARWETSKTAKVVALARKLEHLPQLREALVQGAVAWTTAYIASQAATPETDADWTKKALTLTNEQLETERARAEGRAAVDDAVTAIRSESTKTLSFAEAVAEACKRVVEGGSAGHSKARVVIHVCAECGKATREGKNGPVEISRAELETRACDAEVLDIRRGPAPVSRTIPPKTENYVRARDHDRCRVPGCKNRAHVNLHHEGGWRNVGHAPLSVYVLCVAHHHAIHDGDLVVRTLAPGRFEFLRKDGGLLGHVDLNVPMDDPATFRTEGPSAETVRGVEPGADASGAEGRAVETLRVDEPGSEAFRTEGHAVRDAGGEVAAAMAFLRKLEFRVGEARDLVTRAIQSTSAHATADEIVRAALELTKFPSGAA